MNKIPDGALLQKSKNNVSYVYFPSYYYDKDAKTHNNVNFSKNGTSID